MNILYLECFSGISGDMFISALLDLGLDIKVLQKELAKLNLKGKFSLITNRVKFNGVSCQQFKVKEDESIVRGLEDIKKILQKSSLEPGIKVQAGRMFDKLHKVEERIHREVHHFHELGLLDTVIDIVGAIIGLRLLKIDKVYASKVNVGSGFVNTRHGLLPVPAPATAEILKNIPIFSKGPEAELVTPTGALILSEFVEEFQMPLMNIKKIGYGAGTKKFENFPNFLRAFIGEMEQQPQAKVLIETNIDDLNPQFYEYVMQQLFKNGALDVYFTPIQMKKNRPGIILSCICNEQDEEKILEIIFKETTTIGVRISYPKRVELTREKKKVKTIYGEVEIKISRYHGKIMSITPEYEDCKKLAEKKGVSLKQIYSEVNKKNLV